MFTIYNSLGFLLKRGRIDPFSSLSFPYHIVLVSISIYQTSSLRFPVVQLHHFIMSISIPSASLENKVALITGAGRGIGRGCALELARRGASIIVNYVSSESAAKELCSLIGGFNNGARAVAIQADVSKVSEIHRLFAEAKEAFGKIDIVMSNSGTESWDKTEEVTEEKYDHIFNLNARAQFFVGQTAFKYLEPNGRLILMSSIAAGLLGVKDHALYNASKMAVIGMIKSFATDFGVKGITVNGVAPGGIKSDMFTQNAWHYIPGGTPDWPAEKIEGLMASHCPLGRCAVPEDVARVVAFLASEDGGWVNGTYQDSISQNHLDEANCCSNRPGHYHLWGLLTVKALGLGLSRLHFSWVGQRVGCCRRKTSRWGQCNAILVMKYPNFRHILK
jgi:3-oxoacyl-[acyl-carrier protein] reductase